MALSEYDKKNLSAAQQAQIQALTEEYTRLFNEQKAAKEAGNAALADSLYQQMNGLHGQAEAIRSGAGYSGGDDGTAYIENPKTATVNQPAATNTPKAYKVYTGTEVLNGKNSTSGSGTSSSKSGAGSSSASVATNTGKASAAATGAGLLNGTKPTVTAPKVNQTTTSAPTDPVESTAKTNPDSVMSAEDQARVEYYREIYNDAKARGDQATMDAAHKSAEDIRQGYGYSGGVDGTQYITEGIEAPAGNYKDAGLSAESRKAVDDARLNYYIAQFNDDLEGMDHWHSVAEEERGKYGYSGGADGSEFIPVQTTPAVTTPAATTPTVTTPKEDQTPAVTPKPEPEPEPAPVPVPEIVLPDIPAFSQLNAPDLAAVGMPATPDFGAANFPAAPDFSTIGRPSAPELDALSIPSSPDVQINDYSQYIREMQNAQTEAALAELEGAYRKNVNSIDRAGVGVNNAYRSARNQTAGAADLASRNFAEIANASGLSSGTGGQAALARSVAMQNDMNTLNLQQAQVMADLEQQISDNEAWYNSAIAQAEAEGDSQTAQLLYQEKIRVESETVAAVQQKFANEITLYQQQMDARQQQFANEVTTYQAQMAAEQQQFENGVTAYQAQMNEKQQQFDNEVSQYQMQLDTKQKQFENEVAKKKLEYQELRDSVADAQWQAQFDLAYNQWLKEVETQQEQMMFEREQWETGVARQQEQMAFEREQWETSVAYQQKQMDTAYEQWLQSVANEQAQMDFERAQWEQDVAVKQEQLDMQQKSLAAELEQMDVDNSQWQQEFDAKNSQWQQEFEAESEQWLENFNADLQEYQINGAEKQREELAEYAMAYLKAGVMPSSEMLDAMGISVSDAQRYIDSVNKTGQGAEEDDWDEDAESSNGIVALIQRLANSGADYSTIHSYLTRLGLPGGTAQIGIL